MGSGPRVRDPPGLVLPVREAWNLGASFCGGHAVPLPIATSLQPTWPDLPCRIPPDCGPPDYRAERVLGQGNSA